MDFQKKIIAIQKELKAPKNQKNSFGGYKYRSCEDIFEAVKPLLYKHDLKQTISDELVNIGERYYIKATVTVSGEGGSEQVTAYAREAENKKGMDESQITGTASSYARKYALNGLWLIDDTKDADTDAYTKKQKKAKKNSKPPLYPDSDRWPKAVHSVASGKVDIDVVKKKYDISKEDAERLVTESMEVANGQ